MFLTYIGGSLGLSCGILVVIESLIILELTQEVSRLISLFSSFAKTVNLFDETNDLDFLCSVWIDEFGDDGSDCLGLDIFREVLTIKIMKARITERRP
jgi:hypothetical protein